jgi:hypothetical protein
MHETPGAPTAVRAPPPAAAQAPPPAAGMQFCLVGAACGLGFRHAKRDGDNRVASRLASRPATCAAACGEPYDT